MDNSNEMCARAEERGLPPEMVDPNWNLLARLSPYDQACYMHHQRHRLNHLKTLQGQRADGQHVLLLDEAGLLSAVGVPIPTREQLQRPPPELIYEKSAEENNLKRKASILAKHVLARLNRSYVMRHPAWRPLQYFLTTDLAHYKTPAALIQAVEKAIQEEDSIWDQFPMFDAEFTALEATEIPIARILQGICLAVGYVTEEEDDRFELLTDFCQEFGETVLEFHDMYQRLSAHVAKNGTDKTEAVIVKMKRLKVVWEKILERLTREALAQDMWKILGFWEEFPGYTTEGGDMSSRQP